MILNNYSKEVKEKIDMLYNDVAAEQKKIFDSLLKISKSFSDDDFTKQNRNEIFEKVQIYRDNIANMNKKIFDLENGIVDEVYEEENKKNSDIEEVTQDFVEKLKEVNDLEKNEDNEEEIKRTGRNINNQLIVVEQEYESTIRKFFNRIKGIFSKKKD